MTKTKQIQLAHGMIGSQIPNLMTAAIVLNNNDLCGTIQHLEEVIARLTESKRVLEHVEGCDNA